MTSTDDGYVRPLDADPAPSDLGRELHANGIHTHCPAACLTVWDDDGNDVPTVTVWFIAHDDPNVGYVVNDVDDMRGNYDDLDDPPMTFAEYLATWESATLPRDVWENGDDAAIRALLY